IYLLISLPSALFSSLVFCSICEHCTSYVFFIVSSFCFNVEISLVLSFNSLIYLITSLSHSLFSSLLVFSIRFTSFSFSSCILVILVCFNSSTFFSSFSILSVYMKRPKNIYQKQKKMIQFFFFLLATKHTKM
ncbi:hypothetical protein V8G54_012265, partial [Vigna mungo]